MPFEVYPIEGIASGYSSANANRSPVEVAMEIKNKYNAVAKLGGEIVTSHVLAKRVMPTAGRDGEGRTTRDRSYTGDDVLFLVAKFPESTE